MNFSILHGISPPPISVINIPVQDTYTHPLPSKLLTLNSKFQRILDQNIYNYEEYIKSLVLNEEVEINEQDKKSSKLIILIKWMKYLTR